MIFKEACIEEKDSMKRDYESLMGIDVKVKACVRSNRITEVQSRYSHPGTPIMETASGRRDVGR